MERRCKLSSSGRYPCRALQSLVHVPSACIGCLLRLTSVSLLSLLLCLICVQQAAKLAEGVLKKHKGDQLVRGTVSVEYSAFVDQGMLEYSRMAWQQCGKGCSQAPAALHPASHPTCDCCCKAHLQWLRRCGCTLACQMLHVCCCTPACLQVRALKAYALHRSGKAEEALQVCQKGCCSLRGCLVDRNAAEWWLPGQCTPALDNVWIMCIGLHCWLLRLQAGSRAEGPASASPRTALNPALLAHTPACCFAAPLHT